MGEARNNYGAARRNEQMRREAVLERDAWPKRGKAPPEDRQQRVVEKHRIRVGGLVTFKLEPGRTAEVRDITVAGTVYVKGDHRSYSPRVLIGEPVEEPVSR